MSREVISPTPHATSAGAGVRVVAGIDSKGVGVATGLEATEGGALAISRAGVKSWLSERIAKPVATHVCEKAGSTNSYMVQGTVSTSDIKLTNGSTSHLNSFCLETTPSSHMPREHREWQQGAYIPHVPHWSTDHPARQLDLRQCSIPNDRLRGIRTSTRHTTRQPSTRYIQRVIAPLESDSTPYLWTK